MKRRSCYIVGECLAVAVMASACGGDSDTGRGSPGSGSMSSHGGGSGGVEQGTGGASATGGTSVTGGVAGAGGSDCQCPSAAWEPVCGVDGNSHNAVCGADCVPVDIACVGECPCDSGGASCDIGCEAPVATGWCESPTVTWECGGIDYIDLFAEIGCQELSTGMVRYCCPAGFLSECQ